MEGKKKFLYKDLTEKFLGICFAIQNEIGPFHNERIYHSVLKERLNLAKIPFQSKPKIRVYSRKTGKEVGFYVPDYLLDHKVIVEIKAKPFREKKDEVQLSEYLKTTIYEIGYLINFGIKPLYYKRIIFTNDRKEFLSSADV